MTCRYAVIRKVSPVSLGFVAGAGEHLRVHRPVKRRDQAREVRCGAVVLAWLRVFSQPWFSCSP